MSNVILVFLKQHYTASPVNSFPKMWPYRFFEDLKNQIERKWIQQYSIPTNNIFQEYFTIC